MLESTSRRVAITGIGLVCPLGATRDALWEALSSGTSGVAPLENLPTENLPTSFGGEARHFNGKIDNFGELHKDVKRAIRKNTKLMCREIAMGVAAAQLALNDASLEYGQPDPERVGVIYGADYIMTLPDEFVAGVKECTDENGEFNFADWAEKGLPEVTPLWLLKYLPNMPASHVAIYNDFRGPNNSITVREASANLAIAEAYTILQRGAADIMVAGSTGTRVHPLRTVHMSLQEEIAGNGAEPTKASRPFDAGRTGMVLGEGAAAVVLEEADAAKERGATVFAEVAGYGSSTVADKDFVAKYDVALVNAMRAALDKAGMKPADIGHIHAHGLSTQRCDAEEAAAIIKIFGDKEQSPPVVAAKSYFGNLGAASGMVELSASIMAMHQGELFPTINYETPDPSCPLNIATPGAKPGSSVMNINVTPQGQASAVIVTLPAA